MASAIDELEKKEFEQRSDFIEESDIVDWNEHTDHLAFIQKKLLMSGI
mgnify:CR=1 FL=1